MPDTGRIQTNRHPSSDGWPRGWVVAPKGERVLYWTGAHERAMAASRAAELMAVGWDKLAEDERRHVKHGALGECSLVQQTRKDLGDARERVARLRKELHAAETQVDLRERARAQLGTIGGGNHYVDVFVDEEGRVWVGVHFGSRGFGHTVASNFLALTKGEPWGARVKEHEGLVHLHNPIGHDYWHLMELAGQYAYAGREWVTRKVVEMMGGVEVEMVHNHHNFAWREEHHGEDYIVVRKGATPAWPGQKGFVGASMGEPAVILEGAQPEEGSGDHWLQRQAMYSTVHGAGRVMGRRHAKRTLDHSEVVAWLNRAGVVLRGGGLDEAPQAYKRLPDVLEAQGPTIRVLHTLRPLIVCMAPDNTLDPYKD